MEPRNIEALVAQACRLHYMAISRARSWRHQSQRARCAGDPAQLLYTDHAFRRWYRARSRRAERDATLIERGIAHRTIMAKAGWKRRRIGLRAIGGAADGRIPFDPNLVVDAIGRRARLSRHPQLLALKDPPTAISARTIALLSAASSAEGGWAQHSRTFRWWDMTMRKSRGHCTRGYHLDLAAPGHGAMGDRTIERAVDRRQKRHRSPSSNARCFARFSGRSDAGKK